jgi:hypothetical protein
VRPLQLVNVSQLTGHHTVVLQGMQCHCLWHFPDKARRSGLADAPTSGAYDVLQKKPNVALNRATFGFFRVGQLCVHGHLPAFSAVQQLTDNFPCIYDFPAQHLLQH